MNKEIFANASLHMEEVLRCEKEKIDADGICANIEHMREKEISVGFQLSGFIGWLYLPKEDVLYLLDQISKRLEERRAIAEANLLHYEGRQDFKNYKIMSSKLQGIIIVPNSARVIVARVPQSGIPETGALNCLLIC